MTMAISRAAAVPAPLQAQRPTPASSEAPARRTAAAPVKASSRAQREVDQLFGLTASISGELNEIVSESATKRVQGAEGVSSDQTKAALQKITEKIDGHKSRNEKLQARSEKLSNMVNDTINKGGGVDQVSEVLAKFTEDLIADHGATGHLLSKFA